MSNVAINVALLLPTEAEDRVIAMNSRDPAKQFTPLGKKDYRPHITLAMGIVHSMDLEAIQEYLGTVQMDSFALETPCITYRDSNEGRKSSLEITDTLELHTLHETIFRQVSRHFRAEAHQVNLVDGAQTGMGPGTKQWLNNFGDIGALANYHPHISLGCYDAQAVGLPLRFTAETFGLFHVGDGVTCRKQLAGYKLGK